MKRKIAALTALAMVSLAAPAGAAEPIECSTTMTANPGSADGSGPYPEVIWVGSLVLEDADDLDGAYGLVLTSNDVEGVYRGP